MLRQTRHNASDYFKLLAGLVIFIGIELILSLSFPYLSPSSTLLFFECTLLVLIIIAIVLRGYYFTYPRPGEEIIEKFIAFAIILGPAYLFFKFSGNAQVFVFYIYLVVCLYFMLIRSYTKSKETKHYISICLISIWTLLSIHSLSIQYTLYPIEFFEAFETLPDKSIRVIRTILLIGLILHISVNSVIDAIQSGQNILPRFRIEAIDTRIDPSSYHLLLQPIMVFSKLALLFLNLTIEALNVIVEGFRFIFDALLRFGREVFMNIIKILNSWQGVVSFLILYLLALYIPFNVIKSAPYLLDYIRGEHADFIYVLLKCGIFAILVWLFRSFVTVEFCFIKDPTTRKLFLKRAFYENLQLVLYCFSFYAFFVYISSIILVIYSASITEILGYESVGPLLILSSILLVGAMFYAISVSRKRTQNQGKNNLDDHNTFFFIQRSDTLFINLIWIPFFISIACLIYFTYQEKPVMVHSISDTDNTIIQYAPDTVITD